jgi:hypothetical protein
MNMTTLPKKRMKVPEFLAVSVAAFLGEEV